LNFSNFLCSCPWVVVKNRAYMERLRKQGPVETVTNRDDYRYTLAEENPNIAESFRERLIESGVFLSREDRSPFINLSKDRLSAWTEKGFLSPLISLFCMLFNLTQPMLNCLVLFPGFRLVRATHSCNSGSWYFEVTVAAPKEVPRSSNTEADRSTEGPHSRIGWAQKFGQFFPPDSFPLLSFE